MKELKRVGNTIYNISFPDNVLKFMSNGDNETKFTMSIGTQVKKKFFGGYDTKYVTRDFIAPVPIDEFHQLIENDPERLLSLDWS